LIKKYEEFYQSKEYLEKKYAEKGNIALCEMRDFIPKVEKTS